MQSFPQLPVLLRTIGYRTATTNNNHIGVQLALAKDGKLFAEQTQNPTRRAKKRAVARRPGQTHANSRVMTVPEMWSIVFLGGGGHMQTCADSQFKTVAETLSLVFS